MIAEQEIKQEKKHICARCGQAVDVLKDSWKTGATSHDLLHVTCPVSPELASLPATAAEPEAVPDGPEFLTMDEAAKLLRVSMQTVRRRIRAGELPAVRLRGGQIVLVKRSDVLGLLEPIGREEA